MTTSNPLRGSDYFSSTLRATEDVLFDLQSVSSGQSSAIHPSNLPSIDERIPILQKPLQQIEQLSRKLSRRAPLSTAAPDAITSYDLTGRPVAALRPVSDSANRALEVEAQMFLASKNIDLMKNEQILNDLQLTKAYEQLIPAGFGDLDMDSSLERQQQTVMSAAIEEANKLANATFRRHFAARLEEDWDSAKRDILESLGFRSGRKGMNDMLAALQADMTDATRTPAAQPARAALGYTDGNAAALTGATDSLASFEFYVYSSVVKRLNFARRNDQPISLIDEFKSACDQYDREYFGRSTQQTSMSVTGTGTAPGDVSDAWELLKHMTAAATSSSSLPFTTRPLADDYSNSSVRLRKQLISGALRYSEQLYVEYIKAVVRQHPTERRGIPGISEDILAFVLLQKKNQAFPQHLFDRKSDLYRGAPLWIQIFCCIRCGRFDAARDIGRAVGPAVSSTVLECFQMRAEGRVVTVELLAKLAKESQLMYQTSSAIDIFKLAVFVLLERRMPPTPALSHELMKNIADTTDDYIWWRLSLLWNDDSDIPSFTQSPSEQMSLPFLQLQLIDLNEKHFNPDGRRPLNYFKILLMAQLFEEAVYYLLRSDLFVIAVHFTVALDSYGLIRRARPHEDIVNRITGQNTTINFARVIRKFVEPFMRARSTDAFHYLLLLKDPAINLPSSTAPLSRSVLGLSAAFRMAEDDSDEKSVSSALVPFAPSVRSGSVEVWQSSGLQDALVDLILSSKDYQSLVGKVSSDQLQKSGMIFAYLSAEEARLILLSAGERAVDNGQAADGVFLWTLAEHFDQAAVLLCKELARLVAQPSGLADRQQMIELTQEFLMLTGNSTAVKVELIASDDSSVNVSFSHVPTFSGTASASSSFSSSSTAASAYSTPSAWWAAGVFHQTHRDSLIFLLHLVRFFDSYRVGLSGFDEALQVIHSLSPNVIPLQERLEELNDKRMRFEGLDPAIRRIFGELSVALMDIYRQKLSALKENRPWLMSANQSTHTPGGVVGYEQQRQQLMKEYLVRGRALVSWVGLVDLGSDVNAKLVKLEALMSTL